MSQTAKFQPVLDRARQAVYAAAFVVVIGSLWTIAWANSLDDHARAPGDTDRIPAMVPDNVADAAPVGPDVVTP